MLKRYKPIEDPVEINSIDEFLDVIENFRGYGSLRLRMSESILFLESAHLPIIQDELCQNKRIHDVEINGERFGVPLSEGFAQKFVPLNKLLALIRTSDGKQRLNLEVSSNRILFAPWEIAQIIHAIKSNKKITELHVKNISVPISSVNDFVYAFLGTAHLRRLTFPLLEAVDASSQREVSEFFDELPMKVMRFNRQCKPNRQSFEGFALAVLFTSRRVAQRDNLGQYGPAHTLSQNNLEHIEQFVCGRTKNLRLRQPT